MATAEPKLTVSSPDKCHNWSFPYTKDTTAEDICIKICRELKITPAARHIFALKVPGKNVFLMPSQAFTEKQTNFEFRLRFKVANIEKLKAIDANSYDYYFHQVRFDVLKNKIPGLCYEKYRWELVGLGITDMYRVMLEEGLTKEAVESDYKKYMSKEVLKRHAFFIKRPIQTTLSKLQKAGHDKWFVKTEYLKQLHTMVPEYLIEEYKAYKPEENTFVAITVCVSPFHRTEPGLKYCYDNRKDEWHHICTIENLCTISLKKDLQIEISRKNGIPVYLAFKSVDEMYSFVSLLDGYYRLSTKWTFNLCRDVITPSLQRLHKLKCHGPVGGEFSYAKLEEKRNNKRGCYIMRECELNYDVYYVDVCSTDGGKPKSYKLQYWRTTDEYQFNDDLRKYKSIRDILTEYGKPEGKICLLEFLPPSEYDKSPLLLCRDDILCGDSLTDSSSLHGIIPPAPVCINSTDLQVYKDKKCLKWDKTRSKIKTGDNHTSQEKYDNSLFPDGFRKDAKKYCRNPSGDIGGPWCFVEIEDSDSVEKEYCDVSFCDDQDCMVFTKNTTVYSHYTDLNHTLTNLTFGVKLWDSDSCLDAYARLVLSVMALPVTGEQMEDLGIGIELYISNQKSGLTFGVRGRVEYEETREVLKSTEYTFFSLSWESGFITLNREGTIKPIFLQEFRIKDNLLGFRKNEFKYYSASGSNVMWSFPFCDDDFECDVHTTVNDVFQQYWPLRQTDTGCDLVFYIRGFHSSHLLLVTSPAVEYPRVEILLNTDDNKSRVVVLEYYKAPLMVLKEVTLPNIIDYWQWRKFTVSIFANTLNFYWVKDLTSHVIFELKHEVFRKIRWFSPNSDNTPVMWTFFCEPPGFAQPPQAFPPECALNTREPDYKGSQDITKSGLSCLPWSGKKLLPYEVRESFANQSVFKAWNYCRDPTGDKEGQKQESSEGITVVYRSMWKVTKGKKMEVAMKVLKQDKYDSHLKQFLEVAGRWAYLQSTAIVRLFGLTLMGQISMVIDYARLGPLDEYLRENKATVEITDLVEASANLASALWHLAENGIVHGHIRCRKLLVYEHTANSFIVKLADPGVHNAYTFKEIHWIPVECYTCLERVKQSSLADVWAFATTLYEIFTYGQPINLKVNTDARKYYANRHILPKSQYCPTAIYELMKECWELNPYQRKLPQAITRDINQILYADYNMRRGPAYELIHLRRNLFGTKLGSVNSLTSKGAESLSVDDETEELTTLSDIESEMALLGNSREWDNENLLFYEHNNCWFGQSTTESALIEALESVVELENGCNVVLQGRIGQGFYGEVYRGTLERDGISKMVAIKKLKSSAFNSGVEEDFEREIQIMARLSHPNIVEILGVQRDKDVLLVMEYIEHGSLQNYLKTRPTELNTKQLLTYALDIAKGMEYLGDQKIVHRDLAARNILVVNENHVKISDFGLARRTGANEYYILKTSRELPIKWYALESLEDGRFSARSDVWSYGVTLWEMFSKGEEPNLTTVDLLKEKGQEQMVFLDALKKGTRFPCPPTCDVSIYARIIYPCWDMNPHDRPTFQKLVTDIEDFISRY